MRQVVDEQFLQEARRFRLQFTCEVCSHFEQQSETCAEGFPNHEHRGRQMQPGDSVCFCKKFELA